MGRACRWEQAVSLGVEEESLQKVGERITHSWLDHPRDPSEVLPLALSMAHERLGHRAPLSVHVDLWQEKGTGSGCLDRGYKMRDHRVLWTARKACDRGRG